MKPGLSMVLSLIGAMAIVCVAQATGSLQITATDFSGAVVPGARIHVVGAMERDFVADSNGVAIARGLPAGNYKVIVSSVGFADRTIPNVVVVDGDQKDLQIRLKEALPNTLAIHTYQTLQPNAYSEFLHIVNEPEFCKEPLPEHKQSYRFLWLPTFDHPIFMRVDVQQDGAALLVVKTLSGKGGYEWGHVQTNISRELSPDEHAVLLTTLADIGFWDLPSRVEFKDPFHIILDGTEWVIEGVRDGNCHAITRYSSPLTKIFSQYFLGDVAKLKPYYEDAQ